jgi:hypothetical protein
MPRYSAPIHCSGVQLARGPVAVEDGVLTLEGEVSEAEHRSLVANGFAPLAEQADGLEGRTVPQLRELAEDEGADLAGVSHKAGIIGAIRAHRAAETED